MKLPMNNCNIIECLVYEVKDCLIDKESKGIAELIWVRHVQKSLLQEKSKAFD